METVSSDHKPSKHAIVILRSLLNSEGKFVSGEELATHLSISRGGIWAHIERLRSLGYEIEAVPHLGYRLVKLPDRLIAEEIMARCDHTQVIGRQVIVYQHVSSTNDLVDKYGKNAASEGLVIFAESQHAGRGRLGRKWFSPPNVGLWFSVLLKPTLHPSQVSKITTFAAVAIARIVEKFSQRPTYIKWPNDIIVGSKKIAGILTELHTEMDQIKYVILGIGVNVNQTANQFPPELQHSAASLRIVSGVYFHRAEIASALLSELDQLYSLLHTKNGWDQIAQEWRWRSQTLGKIVCVEVGCERISGKAEAIDENGNLILRKADGTILSLPSGLIIEEE